MKINKKGFTLIEIIFNILILSIILFIIISINSSSNVSNYSNLQNRVLFNLESFLKNIEIRKYDENNTDNKDSTSNNYKYSLINNGTIKLQIPRIGKTQLNNNDYRKGDYNHIETDYTKLGLDSGENPNDITTFDDVDDFKNYTLKDSNGNIYTINGYYFKSNVYYTDDSIYDNSPFIYDYKEKNQNTNIKTIKVIADNPDLNKKIVLYYNSTNIGASRFYNLNDISK